MSYEVARWWAANGTHHLRPVGTKWAEGFDGGALAAGMLAAHFGRQVKVVELGCGDGRLAGSFPHRLYTGLDVCQSNLAAARQAHPYASFREYEPWSPLPASKAVVLWQVALHVPDDELEELVRVVENRVVLIGEMMSPEWRKGAEFPPVFNRSPESYVRAFGRHERRMRLDATNEHYRGRTHPDGRSNDLTVLVLAPC